jgi:hypothetical protein
VIEMTTRELEAGPSKRFFVEMLPRDISLEHAVLDLVDNSLDGAIRQRIEQIQLGNEVPYKDLYCKLTISENGFEILDNCGGIPDDRIDGALKLGRDDPSLDNDKPTIGMYGIGMKRSIFKICADATVTTNSETSAVRVNYDKEWMNPSNSDWTLTIHQEEPIEGEKGVSIKANEIRPNIARSFGSKSFLDDLIKSLSRYYAYVIEKGFTITINDKQITPLPIEFRFAEDLVTPFFYEAQSGNVSIKVIVGLFRKLTREDEREEAIASNDSLEAGGLKAGITVVCNDRVITYADTSSVTGWGVGNVPRCHPQFRSIAGIMVFESDDATTLPVSTTKGALDLDDGVYVKGLNAAMEGLRALTQYTNRVKGIEESTDNTISEAKRYSVSEVTEILKPIARAVRHTNGEAKKTVAKFPEPERKNPMARIAFSRERQEVESIAQLLGLSASETPGNVGEQVWKDLARKLGVIE